VPGDFARIEEDGKVTLLGRGSNCINTGGEKVYPEEVEMAIKGHPGVYDVLVVGVPDEKYGQSVTAVIQPREDAAVELEDLRSYLRAHLSGYKLPRAITLASENGSRCPTAYTKSAPSGFEIRKSATCWSRTSTATPRSGISCRLVQTATHSFFAVPIRGASRSFEVESVTSVMSAPSRWVRRSAVAPAVSPDAAGRAPPRRSGPGHSTPGC